MKKAIVTGSTGLVGSAVVRYLLKNKISVLCVGRKKHSDKELIEIFGQSVTYLDINMNQISSLPEKIKEINYTIGENCVFFSFAWGGKEALTDGGFDKQFINAINSSIALKVAKEIGCIKFVNSGTIQETIAELSIIDDTEFNNSQRNYSISKIASRDMCSMIAYIEKIDYIHTRLSVPIDPNSKKNGYINKVIKNIMNNQEYSSPTNDQLFDITHINDVAKAYYHIGLFGKNKSDYYIGTSSPLTLKNYFSLAEDYKQGKTIELKSNLDHKNIYKNNTLVNETKFEIEYDFINILETFKNK